MSMLAPITSLYAALLGLFILMLAIRIVRLRRSQNVGLGDGGDPSIEQAMRVMSNFVEYVPLALILIGLLELNSTPGWMIHLYGAMLMGGRLLHFSGFSRSAGVTRGRFFGTALTWLVMALASLTNLVHFVVWMR